MEHDSEHNLYLACEDSPQHACFFCTFCCSLLALLASTVHWLRCFSLSQCRQQSAAFSISTQQNTYVVGWPAALSSGSSIVNSAVLPSLSSISLLVYVMHEFPERACECKLTFLSNVGWYGKFNIGIWYDSNITVYRYMHAATSRLPGRSLASFCVVLVLAARLAVCLFYL